VAGGDGGALDRLLVSPLARLGPLDVRAVRRDLLAGHEPDADPRLAHLVALRARLHDRIQRGDTPADLAYEVWASGLADVGATGRGAVDDRALDALVGLVDGLAAYAERNPDAMLAGTLEAIDEGALTPDPWRASASAGHDGVTLTTIAASAGRQWHTVVVAGCVEGELPRTRLRAPLFDHAAVGLAVGDDEERRLFDLATSRATGRLIATAAPEPGVLLSRYVESWQEVTPTLPLAPGLAPPVRLPTSGAVPVSPAGRLTLSASQLETYDDCPLRYAFQYVLRASDEPGVHANLGSLAHDVLAAFLDPAAEDAPARTFEGLLAVADGMWRDDVGRYRPQIEEARRDLVAMLTAWWEVEGTHLPDVVAVERPFDIEVGPHRLTGSIDRIDRVDGGLRIVDYKTGKSEPRPGDVAEDLQLAVYHLAAARDPELATMGPALQLQLHYLRSMRRFDQPVTEEHESRTEERVLATAERILAEDFEPSVDANCRTCSFHRLCPLQDEGRQLHVATAVAGGVPA
jgi:RecB family exonuclease